MSCEDQKRSWEYKVWQKKLLLLFTKGIRKYYGDNDNNFCGKCLAKFRWQSHE